MVDPAPEDDGVLVDAESAAWLAGLRERAPDHHDTVRRLHTLLLRAARSELSRRAGRTGIAGPELDDLAQQAADDAVVAVLRRLPQFRGESRFTTWAYKFAVLEVSSKLGRHFWTARPSVTLEPEQWEQLPSRLGVSPESAAEAAALLAAVRVAVDTKLTAHQRDVFAALVLNGVPLDALVLKLGVDRNAIYKVMFDARRKIRAALVTNGYLDIRGEGER